MKRFLLAGAAVWSLSIAGPAIAADLPINVTKAPVPPPIFDWTSCYLDGHAGGGWSSKDITDPVQLVQDSLSGAPVTTGVTTVSLNPAGVVVGGQFGCDYQFAPNWVAGVEGVARP
jgi:outer membrane immunogenic protein